MKTYRILIPVLILALACNIAPKPGANLIPTISAATVAVAQADTSIPVIVFTPTDASTPTFTPAPSDTLTPSITPSPTITPTPTFDFPTVTVNQQAHCRYGPSAAYLHAADLYPGDVGSVRGRFIYSKWLFVKFDKLKYFCWVAPSVVDVAGDISKIKFTEPNLLAIGSNRFGAPQNVMLVRDGNKVTISWDRVVMDDDDRGYFLELFVCQGGNYLWWTYSYPTQYSTSYTVKDEAGCSEPSNGLLYTVEKHGFSEPVKLHWPAP